MDEKDKAILPSNFPDSIDNLVATELNSEVMEEATPFCEHITKHILSSTNNERCSENEKTASGDGCEKIQNIVIEEKICENRNAFSQPEADALSSSFYTKENKKYEATEQKASIINKDNISNSNDSRMFRSAKNEIKENVTLDIEVRENECPSFPNHSVISKDNVVVKELEITKTVEDSHNVLFSENITQLHVPKHNITEEKYMEFEEIISPEVDIKNDLSISIEFEHSKTSIPVCKSKTIGNTLDVLHPECNKSFASNIDDSKARINIQNKTNCETVEKVISNDSDSFNNITTTKLDSEIIDEATPFYENITEITPSSVNNKCCSGNEETESSYVCEKIQSIVTEEKICENESVSSQPDSDDLTSNFYTEEKNNFTGLENFASASILELGNEINGTNDLIQMEKNLDNCKDLNLDLCCSNAYIRTEAEKKLCENEVIIDDGSQCSSSFISSEINKNELITTETEETVSTIPYNDNDWVIILSSECTNFKEPENIQQEARSEIIETTNEGNTSKIFDNKHLNDLTPVCTLKGKNEFEGRDFHNLHQTIGSNISSLINNTISDLSSHSVSEDKIDNTNQNIYLKTVEDALSLNISEKRENAELENITECELIKTEGSDYVNPPSSAYFVAEECKLHETENKEKNRSFSNDECQGNVFFKDVEASKDQNIKNESEPIETINSADKKCYERIFSFNDLTSFDNSDSENLLACEESELADTCSLAETGNITGEIQQNDLQKNTRTYLLSNEIDYTNEEENTTQKIILNKDYKHVDCKTVATSSNKCKYTNQNYNIVKQTSTCESLASKNCEIRDPDIRTLDDALRYFNLFPLMEQLETSFEDVKRRRKRVEAHEMLLKEVDKQVQKLSFKFHPDRVRNRDGSEEEIEISQKLQASINAVRVALNTLNCTFLENIDTDHRYEFYTKLNLSSLGNENEVKSHVYEVFFQIGLLSDIKQRNIITEIRKFLVESQCCIQSYFHSNKSDFQKYRDLALFHLKRCIKGYKRLQNELKIIQNKCKVEKLDNISCSLDKMAAENHVSLTYLRNLKRIVKASINGSFHIFTTSETLDEYFILPFVYYVNIILMCNVMIQNEDEGSGISILKFPFINLQAFKINGISFTHPYLLALSFVDKNQCKWLFKDNMSKEELKEEFDKYLRCFNDYLTDTFRECNYTESGMTNCLSEDLKKCMKMMFDFQTKEKELSKNIETFKRKTEEIDERYETVMKQNEEFNRVVKERIEKNKKLAEQTSLALSEKF